MLHIWCISKLGYLTLLVWWLHIHIHDCCETARRVIRRTRTQRVNRDVSAFIQNHNLLTCGPFNPFNPFNSRMLLFFLFLFLIDFRWCGWSWGRWWWRTCMSGTAFLVHVIDITFTTRIFWTTANTCQHHHPNHKSNQNDRHEPNKDGKHRVKCHKRFQVLNKHVDLRNRINSCN